MGRGWGRDRATGVGTEPWEGLGQHTAGRELTWLFCTVALNYQSEGRMLQLNRAKFSANGSCGYVLKPSCMCQGERHVRLPGAKRRSISYQEPPRPSASPRLAGVGRVPPVPTPAACLGTHRPLQNKSTPRSSSH